MNEDIKRLFFAYEIASPWPTEYPKDNVIDPTSRHLTLAFLGNTSHHKIKDILNEFPMPPFKVGPVGFFNKCLFLPERNPHVVAWHLESFEHEDSLVKHQTEIANWLRSHSYLIDKRPFLSHVTIARKPQHGKLWEEQFIQLPCIINGLHLYESTGERIYSPIWSYPILPAFEELDHTADIAFCVRAESIPSLHLHAQIALAFKFPPLLNYIKEIPLKNSLDEIIMALNQLVSRADCDLGCPLKAVSFHGDIVNNNQMYTWEMIVDV